MSKNIQISIELFTDITEYFVNGCTDVEQFQLIKKQICEKLDSMQRRALFSGYKSSSGVAREQLRGAYLDSVGMLPAFRSERETCLFDEVAMFRNSNENFG